MIRRIFIQMGSMASMIPPLGLDFLWPSLALITVWTSLGFAGLDPDSALVTSVVLAMSSQAWRRIPEAMEQRSPDGPSGNIAVALAIGLIGAILISGEAIVAQRTISVLLMLGAVLALTYRDDASSSETAAEAAFHRHVGFVRSGLGLCAIAVNEALIVAAPLYVWVVVMALGPLLYHAMFWLILFVTTPDYDDPY
jgi:hypothetical protein